MKSIPNLTCSIVLYKHSPGNLTGLIKGVLECGLVKTLFLIDNSPTDDLKVLATDERIKYIFNNANIGYGGGHNIAMRKALGFAKYHAVLNPDIMFNPGTLEGLYDYMETHADVGHVMPKIKYPDGSIQHLCKLIPTPFDLIARRFVPERFTKKQTAHFELHDSGYNKLMEVPYLSGCFMFFRIETVQKIGFFDEDFFMYSEDIDISRRIYKVAKTMFYPTVEAIHVHERGSYKNTRLLWIHIVNIIRYFNKWGWFFDKERKRINKKILQQIKNNKSID